MLSPSPPIEWSKLRSGEQSLIWRAYTDDRTGSQSKPAEVKPARTKRHGAKPAAIGKRRPGFEQGPLGGRHDHLSSHGVEHALRNRAIHAHMSKCNHVVRLCKYKDHRGTGQDLQNVVRSICPGSDDEVLLQSGRNPAAIRNKNAFVQPASAQKTLSDWNKITPHSGRWPGPLCGDEPQVELECPLNPCRK